VFCIGPSVGGTSVTCSTGVFCYRFVGGTSVTCSTGVFCIGPSVGGTSVTCSTGVFCYRSACRRNFWQEVHFLRCMQVFVWNAVYALLLLFSNINLSQDYHSRSKIFLC
jgi:hypothetical protein